ncbi:Glycosyltransferase domain [Candidatus Methylopumilus universalis]|uniref:TIGR00180 family glycosyltransferase n=1 Tax=Candidatus Methylopumilus universalis TaxID=2588536 RepID=UPI003BEF4BAB
MNYFGLNHKRNNISRDSLLLEIYTMNLPLYDLTLIVPTFNRQSFALRNMRYWSGRDIVMHVMDGTKLGLTPLQLAQLDDNIHYHHMPELSIGERLNEAIDLIETPYVTFLSDDEFFIPSALSSCISQLKADDELVSCMGLSIQFEYKNGNVIGRRFYQSLENYSLLQTDALERMLAHMDPYVMSSMNSVVRSVVWKRSMRLLCIGDLSTFNIGELLFELAVCFQGKTKVISEIMWLRSYENKIIIDHAKTKSFFIWWRSDDKSEDRSKLLSCISSILTKTSNEREMVKSFMLLALNRYVNTYDKIIIGKDFFNDIIVKIWLLIPNNIKNILRLVLKPFIKFNTTNLILLVAKEWSHEGVKTNFIELCEIEKVIQYFYKVEK